jgi:hypothetical protein
VVKGRQVSKSSPAYAAAVLSLKIVMFTVSMVMASGQGPLSVVQTKVFTPMDRPTTLEPGSVGSAKRPAPLTKVHSPVAGKVGVLPSM